MQHKRSRLTTKILAFVLILALVFPASAFASVADVAKDTRSPGKSLANTYPAYTDIEWQISLAENAQAMVTVPTNMTEEELGTALSGDLTLSLDRDSTRGYLNPEKFPYPYQGGALDTWMTQWTKDKQPQNLFRVTEMGISVDEAGKVSLKLWIDINCYFGNRSGSVFCGRDESADAGRERTGRSRADDFRHQRGQNVGGAERGNHLHHDRQKHDEHPRVH